MFDEIQKIIGSHELSAIADIFRKGGVNFSVAQTSEECIRVDLQSALRGFHIGRDARDHVPRDKHISIGQLCRAAAEDPGVADDDILVFNTVTEGAFLRIRATPCYSN